MDTIAALQHVYHIFLRLAKFASWDLSLAPTLTFNCSNPATIGISPQHPFVCHFSHHGGPNFDINKAFVHPVLRPYLAVDKPRSTNPAVRMVSYEVQYRTFWVIPNLERTPLDPWLHQGIFFFMVVAPSTICTNSATSGVSQSNPFLIILRAPRTFHYLPAFRRSLRKPPMSCHSNLVAPAHYCDFFCKRRRTSASQPPQSTFSTAPCRLV